MTRRVRTAIVAAVAAMVAAVGVGYVAAAPTAVRATCTPDPAVADGARTQSIRVTCSIPKPPAVTVTATATRTVTPAPTVVPTSTPTTSATPSQTPTASPTVTASPTPTPSSAGGTIVLGRSFPNAATTGVPPGTTLTPYTGPCTLSDPNAAPALIDRKVITCDQFRLLQPGVKITNSIINGTVYSDCCYLNGSFAIVDSEIRGPNSAATVVGEARFKLLRVEVTGGSRSVNCNDTCEVRDSYIHGQYTDLRGIDHESGIRQDGHGTIVHNTITCDARPVPPDAGCSAAISGYGDFGPVNNNTIDNNLIDGGPDGSMSYCLYGGSTKGKPYPNANNIKVTNNIFMRGPGGKCGIYGPVTSFDANAPGNVWSNNLWSDGSGPVPPAN